MAVEILWFDPGQIALAQYSGQIVSRDLDRVLEWLEDQLRLYPEGFHAISEVSAVTGVDMRLMQLTNVPAAMRIFPRLRYMAVVGADQANLVALNYTVTLWQNQLPDSLFQGFASVEEAVSWLRNVQDT
jgi:hypothetical protein